MAEVDLSLLDPGFRQRLQALQAAAKAQGIDTTVINGFRSLEDQKELYANYQAGLRGLHGANLPFPKRGDVPLAAVPGTSLHEKGLAADVQATDPNQQAALRALGPSVGLDTIGASDPDHFQMPHQGGPSRPVSPTPGPMMFGGLNPDARGMRNNNPGNLVANSFTAGLPGYKGSDGRFAIFDTPEHGAAALDRNLASYGSKGINTPLGIASTWAPASDNNDPASYGGRIASALGVGPNDKIDMNDPAIRNKVAGAIGLVENGPGNSLGFRTAYGGAPATPEAQGTTLNTTTPGAVTTPAQGLAKWAQSPEGKKAEQDLDKALTGQGQKPEIPQFQIAQPMLQNSPGRMGIEAQAAQMMPTVTGYTPQHYGTLINSPGMQPYGDQPPGPPSWMQAGLQQPPGYGTQLTSPMLMAAMAQGYPYYGGGMMGSMMGGGFYG